MSHYCFFIASCKILFHIFALKHEIPFSATAEIWSSNLYKLTRNSRVVLLVAVTQCISCCSVTNASSWSRLLQMFSICSLIILQAGYIISIFSDVPKDFRVILILIWTNLWLNLSHESKFCWRCVVLFVHVFTREICIVIIWC